MEGAIGNNSDGTIKGTAIEQAGGVVVRKVHGACLTDSPSSCTDLFRFGHRG